MVYFSQGVKQEDIGTNAVRCATHRHYANFVGYEWFQNVSEDRADEILEKNKRDGLDVILGDVAFKTISNSSRTEVDPRAKAMLIRRFH
ncbi:MAG: hypothetical protein WC438_03910 [Candidatus Pacearchaeota archaeon]